MQNFLRNVKKNKAAWKDELTILSLRAVAVLLRDRREGIGSSDGGVSKKHVQGALQLAENAALEHASMVQHLRR